MLDQVFTGSGEIFSLAAFAMWLWLAVRAFPGLDTLTARHEDDLRLGATASKPIGAEPMGKWSRVAVSLTVIAVIFSAVGYAIPD